MPKIEGPLPALMAARPTPRLRSQHETACLSALLLGLRGEGRAHPRGSSGPADLSGQNQENILELDAEGLAQLFLNSKWGPAAPTNL